MERGLSGNPVKPDTAPRGLGEIGEGAFYKTALVDVVIPDAVQTLGNFTFSHIDTLETVDLGESLASIGDTAFANTKITSIILPNSIQSIGSGAFLNSDLETFHTRKYYSAVRWSIFRCLQAYVC